MPESGKFENAKDITPGCWKRLIYKAGPENIWAKIY